MNINLVFYPKFLIDCLIVYDAKLFLSRSFQNGPAEQAGRVIAKSSATWQVGDLNETFITFN